jgi:hypothetical protein
MLWLFWSLVLLVAICTGLLVLALRGKQTDKTFRTLPAKKGPETLSSIAVRWRALRTAVAGLSGKPKG